MSRIVLVNQKKCFVFGLHRVVSIDVKFVDQSNKHVALHLH